MCLRVTRSLCLRPSSLTRKIYFVIFIEQTARCRLFLSALIRLLSLSLSPVDVLITRTQHQTDAEEEKRSSEGTWWRKKEIVSCRWISARARERERGDFLCFTSIPSIVYTERKRSSLLMRDRHWPARCLPDKSNPRRSQSRAGRDDIWQALLFTGWQKFESRGAEGRDNHRTEIGNDAVDIFSQHTIRHVFIRSEKERSAKQKRTARFSSFSLSLSRASEHSPPTITTMCD